METHSCRIDSPSTNLCKREAERKTPINKSPWFPKFQQFPRSLPERRRTVMKHNLWVFAVHLLIRIRDVFFVLLIYNNIIIRWIRSKWNFVQTNLSLDLVERKTLPCFSQTWTSQNFRGFFFQSDWFFSYIPATDAEISSPQKDDSIDSSEVTRMSFIMSMLSTVSQPD